MINNFIKRAAEFFSGAEGEQLDKPKEPWYPTPDGKPIRDHESIQAKGLPSVNNWAHPLKDKNNPLLQLTQMANAAAGSYPLGVGGLWHGGVHFDSGTGVSDQAGVHCLADGEVVAYRVDSQAPMTTYQVNRLLVKKPFSRNFVLVRHVLQAPKIEGISATPPRLIFYSLYMHLQNWDEYQKTQSLTRPAFWPEGETYVVPETVADKYPGSSEALGLNIRHQSRQGKVLDLLPRGAEIKISGEGDYRKLENTPGPRYLQDPNGQGSLLGYVRFDQLKAIGNGEHVVEKDLDVHTETNARSETIGPKLPTGSLVTVSGEGDFRKLERVNQYVHFKSLHPTREPLKLDDITLIDEHLPIKAGELIGHLGEYQDYAADRPEKKLHLEVFSEDDVDKFIKDCREWALKLPAASKTWLKLVKGTVVAAHQEHFSATKLPTFNATDAVSGTDLLVPKSLLDNLRATEKITVPATEGRKAYNWYRLDRLLNDANNHLLSGWVREEVGVTPWVSPWEWEGYDILTDYTTSPAFMASFLRSYRRFSDEQLQRYGPLADVGDTGPIKKRLYDIIDCNRDNKITAEEIQAAMRIPAHAQSISQLIIRYESEWYYKPRKWDGLDEMFGHGGSTPHLNWMAEKERIKQISWWDAVADKVGLPSDGKVYHLHPLGLMGGFHINAMTNTTYRIHQSGRIEKIKLANASEEQERDAYYIYIDESGAEHNFGKFAGTKAERWIKKGVKAKGEVIYLMDVSGLGLNPARSFGFRFAGTDRKYLNQSALASLIGVLMDVGYQDVVSTGFSRSDGSPGVSASHINGENGDFRFLRLDEAWSTPTYLDQVAGVDALDELRQGRMNDALYKFGWRTQYAWRYMKDGRLKLLPRTIHLENHHHHLHVGKYAPNIVEVAK